MEYLQERKLIYTADGSHTIYVPDLDEHYHSVHGAIQESQFIFILNGFNACHASPVSVLEIGFGTGLNTLLTAINAKAGSREVLYTTIERFPLRESVLSALNYPQIIGENSREIFGRIHQSSWDTTVRICENFCLKKVKSDLAEWKTSDTYDLIYFDAFGPDKQPEMWKKEVFSYLSAVTVKDGILVTYSAKGEVKRNLMSCGFNVELLPGPPGKRQIIRATKK